MKRAILSVFNKVGVAEFARGLVELGYEILSSGGTYRLLTEQNVPVTAISEVTNSPEILDGRVKTLHPMVHGGILAQDKEEHRKQLDSIGAQFIDLVAVNLYPFAAVSQDPTATNEQVIEMIDIGGPTLLRAAAKNHQRVISLCDPVDYEWVLAKLKQDGGLTDDDRRKLAGKAFSHTAFYDSLIAQYLQDEPGQTHTLPLEKVTQLRYGENPHQRATLYREIPATGGIVSARQLQGKELSFNNYLDGDAAYQMVSAFDEPCVVAVKHGNPCGLAVGEMLADTFDKVYQADPVSIFGGIVAANRRIDRACAEKMSKVFLEVVIAPEFSEEALEILSKKPNLRVLELSCEGHTGYDLKRVSGGLLLQEADQATLDPKSLRVVTKQPVDDLTLQDLVFAWKVVKFVKSNAIVVAKDQRLIGVGAGQMNRVQSMKLALEDKDCSGAVVASDAFFPFADNIKVASQHNIKAIIQPGGSKRDQEVIEECNRQAIGMVFTGIRHFRH